MKETIDFIIRGSEVTRYHTLRTIQEETVGHHSHLVAMFCFLLTEASPNLIFAALTHDLAEHVTGDLPSPIKRQLGIGEQFGQLEEELMETVGLVTDLDESEKRTLKVADIFSGITFCTRELELGNRNIRPILNRYVSYAEALVLVGEEQRIFNILKEKINECR